MNILVTGGAGFIGSNLVNALSANQNFQVFVIDNLTYAGNKSSIKDIESGNIVFYQTDICNLSKVEKIIDEVQPNCIFHLAAESHVDNSILAPEIFIQTNLIGTFNLLHASQKYYKNSLSGSGNDFRFIHISTDEVFGDLGFNKEKFTEETPYNPSSPYSASKAGSDHLVRAWYRTYDLPTIITNCSNNYGPFQNPEKLIPKTIINSLSNKPIPIYGTGNQVRDWLYVEDHILALLQIFEYGEIGESYNIGGSNEVSNLEIAEGICKILSKRLISKDTSSNDFSKLITFVNDRPGHDIRYAIDSSKVQNNTSWKPLTNLSSGLEKTVDWYLSNKWWWEPLIKK